MKQLVTRVLAIVALVGSAAQAQTLPKEIRTRIMQSVVEVLALDNDAGAPKLGNQGGSGTMISTSGYILTNYHVVFDDDTNSVIKRHAIRFTDNPSKEPVLKGIGTVVSALPKLDLALLKITQDATGNPISSDIKYVASPIGNPFDMVLGERLTLAGYPNIGGRTITFTNGVFSGWTGENYRSAGTNWIKTDGKINAGNSGGGAFDEQGNLIGVPTAGIFRRLSALNVENQDYLRPIHLAYQIFDPNVSDIAYVGGRRPTLPDGVDATGLASSSASNANGLLPAKVGQAWSMTIEGLPAWTLNLSRLDRDNDPTGNGSQAGSNQQFIVYTYEDDGSFFFHVESSQGTAYGCVFEDPIAFKDNTLLDGKALISPPNVDSWQSLKKPCTVTLLPTAATPPPAPNGPPPLPTNPPNTTTPSNPSNLTAVFPPKPGQTWQVVVQGLEPWTLQFLRLDRDGDPEGTSKQGSFSSSAYAFTDSENGEKNFQFFDPTGTFWCVFPKNVQANGASFTNGETWYKARNQQAGDTLRKPCTATITSAGNPTVLSAPPVMLELKSLLKFVRI